jgi:hypothetical protein
MNADLILASLAARSLGVFTHDEATAEGLTDRMIERRRESGLVVTEWKSVYRHAAVRYTHDTRLMIAVKACGPDSLLSFRSAAVRLGFPRLQRVKPEVTSPHRDMPRYPDATRHRTQRPFRPGEVVWVRGIPCTSPGRTALDLCSVMPYDEVSEVIAEAIVCKVLGVPQLLGAIERAGGRGVGGTVACRAIAEGAIELEGLESILEYAVAKIVDRARVPRPVRQYPLTCADGREVRLDNAWVDEKLAVEPNGMRWHATPARLRETQARSRSIQGTGWRHLMYGWADAHEDADATQREIEWHYAERRRQAA